MLWPFDLKQLKAILGIAIPITLQSIFFASKGVTDILMIGQLSEDAVAAVGVAGRALFVAKDEHGTRRTLAMTWLVSSVVELIRALGFGLYGQNIIGLSTDFVAIRELGHQYLAITGLSLFFVAFNGAVAAGLRSIRQAKLSGGLSAFGVGCNLVLNAILIFGLFIRVTRFRFERRCDRDPIELHFRNLGNFLMDL
ncbi:MATE family efflux transporter [Vibrio profundi]|uniref:MATE family efflux transporter n=1 Tax=Vibrio profundi TaxID=1774960 RepID=UPI00373515B0